MAPIILLKAVKRQRCDTLFGGKGSSMDMRNAVTSRGTSKRIQAESSTSNLEAPPTKRQRRHGHETQHAPAQVTKINAADSPKSLQSLPPEVFCNVLSFVGPTSMSLLSLSGTNKYLHKTMKAIGDSMLPRALSHYRIPLKRLHARESSLSYFLRHAKTCSHVLNDVQHLRDLLARNPNRLSSSEVDHAMKLTLDLLDVAPALSVALERQILSTCGKCGGKVFKHSKWMLFHALSGTSSPPLVLHGATPNHVLEERLQELQALYAKNQERLDMSRLIMQTVVFRELQLARTHPTGASSPMLAALSDRQRQRQAPLSEKMFPSRPIGFAYF